MEETKTCPKCEGNMEKGLVIDRGDYSSIGVPKWAKGVKWGGFGIEGKTIDVVSFRCQSCGYLESYAVEDIDKNS